MAAALDAMAGAVVGASCRMPCRCSRFDADAAGFSTGRPCPCPRSSSPARPTASAWRRRKHWRDSPWSIGIVGRDATRTRDSSQTHRSSRWRPSCRHVPRRSVAPGGRPPARSRGARTPPEARRAGEQRRRHVLPAPAQRRWHRDDVRAQPPGAVPADHAAARSPRASAPARVITTASEAHRSARIACDDPGAESSYRAFARYRETKLAHILFTSQLAQRAAGSGVSATCFYLGLVASNFNPQQR